MCLHEKFLLSVISVYFESPTIHVYVLRMIFAVVTIASVFLYDTQHSFPFARLTGLHLAPINDATWAVSSKNSRSNIILTVCSSDGYLTFVRFEAGALGTLLLDAVLKLLSSLYAY